MSLISVELLKDTQGKITNDPSPYDPDPKEKERIAQVRSAMVVGYMNMTTPRREFSDLSLLERMSVDRMSWNTYQPNNGDPYQGDPVNSWKSNAIKPIVRNKAISVAAHATAALIFPKVFAQDEGSNEDRDAAKAMRSLIEWSAYQSKYPRMFVHAVINMLTDPLAIIYTDYAEVYRTVRHRKEGGGFTEEEMLDENYSGFQNMMVQANELYIENFYEPDIQKQGFLLWRKVITYEKAKAKYEKEYPNFKFVKPGMQTVYSDANNIFYYVYDTNLTGDLVEEAVYWNKTFDLKQVMINGILLTDPDEPNPRLDKQYPFATGGYEYIDGGRCLYYKSLVFKMGPDAKIINELYPMIVDGTYLSIFPPMVARGGEEIGSAVIVPGAVTTFSSPDADLKPINTANNLAAGMNTMMDVIGSVNESSQDPQMAGMSTPGTKTAYQTSILQKNSMTEMSLFMKMVGYMVEDFGKLRVSDILQHLTVGEAMELTGGKTNLKYKSFLLPETTDTNGRRRSRKVEFDLSLPSEPTTEDEIMKLSMEILKMEGGPDAKKEIFRANPQLFRKLKYHLIISPDVLNPLSEEVEHAFQLEAYDRMIANPTLDQNEVTRDFLLNAYSISKDNPDKYFAKAPGMMPGGQNPPGLMGQQGPSPSANDILSKVAQSTGKGQPMPPRSSSGGRQL